MADEHMASITEETEARDQSPTPNGVNTTNGDGVTVETADKGTSEGKSGQSSTPHRTHIRSLTDEYGHFFRTPPEQQNSNLVVVRYFLDRPGYGLHNSAARFWFHPPAVVTPGDIKRFLNEQGIALDGLLVEVYLDKFRSFMMLEACEASLVEWNFEDTTHHDPGVLNLRLTDIVHAEQEEEDATAGDGQKGQQFPSPQHHHQNQGQHQPQQANTTPAGLFSFSMMVGLETTALTAILVPGSVDPSFVLVWGPYMMFVGGLLQIIVGIFQVLRNNIYGATAFLGFGSFWFANGTKVILENFYSVDGSRADELLESADGDPLGHFLRNLYIFAFSCCLLKQTFVMNKLSTTLITLLCLKAGAAAFTGWSVAMQWVQFVFGWITSAFAFYVFAVEFTNQVYHREVFPVFKWSDKHSPEEVFGAAGRTGTLHSKAARLRRASYMSSNVRRVRSADYRQVSSQQD